MDDEQKAVLSGMVIVFMSILIFAGMMCGAYYINHKIKVDNFQKTIKDLSDEQKCMHICAFEYPAGYFDQYKFCIEKCDRISERERKCEAN